MADENRNEYEGRLEAEVDKMDARIEELKAKMKKADADVRIKYQQELNDIEEKRTIMKMRIQKLKNASGEAWQEISTGLEKAAKDLSDAISNAYNKLKT